MDIKALKKAKKLIKEFEGLRLSVYKCPAGVNTIGWGHVICKHDNIGNTITAEVAEALLEQDINIAYACLMRNINGVELNHNQQAALISFIFNLGSGNFQSSTLRQKLLREEYALAASEFNRFVFAGGRRLRGLEKRRQCEKELFEKPIKHAIIYPNVSTPTVSIWSRLKNVMFSHVVKPKELKDSDNMNFCDDDIPF